MPLIQNLDLGQLPDLQTDVVDFLRGLGGPSLIRVPGLDDERCRFVVTLLHGNEPSGLIAIQRWLASKPTPACDTYCAIMNVEAALTEPVFSYRHLPGKRDLNRCFKPPYSDEEGSLAEALLMLIHERKPEALIDIHNTSGVGPSFGVATFYDDKHDALVSLFSERLIITDLRLGALMELSEADVPTVTIECGGAKDDAAHQLAYDGLEQFTRANDLFVPQHAPWPIDVLKNPVRLELGDGIAVRYAENVDSSCDLTVPVDLEHLNFHQVGIDQCLGWANEKAWENLRVVNSQGLNLRDEYLTRASGIVRPAQPLTLFMITGDPAIAKSDCLLYACTAG